MRFANFLCLLAVALLSGCASYRVDASTDPAPGPASSSGTTRSAIVLASTDVLVNGAKPATDDDVRKIVIDTLRQAGFQQVLMPWDDTDARASRLEIKANYFFDPNTAKNNMNAFIIGLTLFLLAPVVEMHSSGVVTMDVIVKGPAGTKTAKATSTGQTTFKILAPANELGETLVRTITNEALRSCLQRTLP